MMQRMKCAVVSALSLMGASAVSADLVVNYGELTTFQLGPGGFEAALHTLGIQVFESSRLYSAGTFGVGTGTFALDFLGLTDFSAFESFGSFADRVALGESTEVQVSLTDGGTNTLDYTVRGFDSVVDVLDPVFNQASLDLIDGPLATDAVQTFEVSLAGQSMYSGVPASELGSIDYDVFLFGVSGDPTFNELIASTALLDDPIPALTGGSLSGTIDASVLVPGATYTVRTVLSLGTGTLPERGVELFSSYGSVYDITFTVAPSPAGCAVLALAGLGVVRRRR